LLDSHPQNFVQRDMNSRRLNRPDVPRRTARMDLGSVQDFVTVNVSDPGDQMLVEQSRLHCPSGGPQDFS
jgi:hypothetical protein